MEFPLDEETKQLFETLNELEAKKPQDNHAPPETQESQEAQAPRTIEQHKKNPWIIIGISAVLAVAIISSAIIYRKETGQLWDRMLGVNVILSETPLGEVIISNIPVKPKAPVVEGFDGNSYVCQPYKFKISWPDNDNWTASKSLAEKLKKKLTLPITMDIPIVITTKKDVAHFQPTINVMIDSVENVSIKDYMSVNMQGLQSGGWEVVSSEMDEETQGGFLVLVNNTYNEAVYLFQRIAVMPRHVYVITANQLPPDSLFSQTLREELKSIFDSLTIFEE